MTIISQLGVVLLVIIMGIIIAISNRSLTGASEEGEHFVDEWAMKEERKEQRLEEKKRREEEKKRREEEKRRHLEERRSSPPAYQKGQEVSSREQVFPKQDARVDYGFDFNDRRQEEDFPGWNEKKPAQAEKSGYQQEVYLSSAPTQQWNSEKIVPIRLHENPHAFSLIMREKGRPEKRVGVHTFPYFIGRGDNNQLVLDHLCIANRHAVITLDQDRIFLKDMGTANKIFSGGRFVESLELSDQMEFTIGDVDFVVEMAVGPSVRTRNYANM